MGFKEVLWDGALGLGLSLKDPILARYEAYYRMMVEWNERINLTSITEPEEAAVKHFLDSLTVVQPDRFPSGKGVDVGTGAGFPGMVLALFDPSLEVVLLDSLGKRCEFLRCVASTLGVRNVEIIHGRAEDYGQGQGREAHDWVIARAVCRLPVLAEYCLPLCRVGGLFVAMKGREGEVEVEEARNALEILGGRLEEIRALNLPDGSGRQIIYVRKHEKTAPKYPRKAGIPSKKPL